jgi:DNA-binding LacI/PurR family transcriptional regulator
VSHALSGRRSVSAAMLARVRQAADELGYRPNQVASSLRTKRTHMVGLLVPDIANPFYPAVARGLHDAIAADGYAKPSASYSASEDPLGPVVCANDLIAIGALEAAQAAGSTDPTDLAVIGYDDIDAASLVAPPLTTVVLPAHEFGRQSGRLLLDRLIDGFDGPPRTVVVPTRLAVRATA